MLHQFGASLNVRASRAAAAYPNVACLQYLHQNGCPWDEDTPDVAAKKGCIEPLGYALEQGCPYNGFIMQWAARSNILECLQYLIEEQIVYMDEEVFLVALLRGDLACLQYLVDQGCPYQDAVFSDDPENLAEFDKIFQKYNPDFVQCVEYAVERGWTPDVNIFNYIVTRDEPCKRWGCKRNASV